MLVVILFFILIFYTTGGLYYASFIFCILDFFLLKGVLNVNANFK